MKRTPKRFYVLIGASVLILTGCQSASAPKTTPTPPASESIYDNASTLTTAKVGTSYRYNLLTHCGIEYLRFDAKEWKSNTHLGDGMGNPPPDWPNPFALGVVTLLNASQLTFTFPGKPPVQFHVTSENVPICS
jgi:hypothetical protein